jgi:hypothetical protein
MHQIAGTRLIKLAHRSSADVDVSLFWVEGDGDDKAVVCVRDTREGDYFEIPTERYLALDVYYHPFAYRDFSTAAHLYRGRCCRPRVAPRRLPAGVDVNDSHDHTPVDPPGSCLPSARLRGSGSDSCGQKTRIPSRFSFMTKAAVTDSSSASSRESTHLTPSTTRMRTPRDEASTSGALTFRAPRKGPIVARPTETLVSGDSRPIGANH